MLLNLRDCPGGFRKKGRRNLFIQKCFQNQEDNNQGSFHIIVSDVFFKVITTTPEKYEQPISQNAFPKKEKNVETNNLSKP